MADLKTTDTVVPDGTIRVSLNQMVKDGFVKKDRGWLSLLVPLSVIEDDFNKYRREVTSRLRCHSHRSIIFNEAC